MEFDHETVLLHPTIDMLEVNPNGAYVDCTLGGGGHSKYLLSLLSERGHIYAFDQDLDALAHGEETFAAAIQAGRMTLIHSNFRYLEKELRVRGVHYVDGIYYDLGVSSPQLDRGDRGFSYKAEAPLDMRMNQSQDLTAYDLVNTWPVEELAKVLSRYGEERFAGRIAARIDLERQLGPIQTTTQLADIIKEAIPAATRRTGGHPARRSFQGIRIAVNDELQALEESLKQGLDLLKIGGRMAAISFHSLEDRIVKQVFKEASSPQDLPMDLPLLPSQLPQADFALVNRKPILPDEEELGANPRSRSAKLRLIERRHFPS